MRKNMKRNYKILSLLLLLAFGSCSFTTKKFSNPDKDKLLIQIITFVLEQGHFDPIDLDHAHDTVVQGHQQACSFAVGPLFALGRLCIRTQL